MPKVSSQKRPPQYLQENTTLDMAWVVLSNPTAQVAATLNSQHIAIQGTKSGRFEYLYMYKIKSVQCKDAGKYSLNASNSLGYEEDTFDLTVFCEYIEHKKLSTAITCT